MRALLALAALSTLAGCGAPLLSVGADAKKICVRQLGETLPGTSNFVSGSVAGEVHEDVVVDTSQIPDLQQDDLSAKLRLLSFQLSAPGVLAGVQELRVSIAPPPGSTLPAIVLADYPGEQNGATVHIDGDVLSVDVASLQKDLVEYLHAKAFTVRIDAAGGLPANDWQADVEVCAKAEATLDYGSKL